MTNWKQGDKATWSKAGSLLTLTHVGRNCFIAEHEDYGELSGEIVDLRPIKTDAEIERDRVIKLSALKLLKHIGASYDAADYRLILPALYDAGLLSDPAKRVKPIGFDEFSKAFYMEGSCRPIYHRWISKGIIKGVDNE